MRRPGRRDALAWVVHAFRQLRRKSLIGVTAAVGVATGAISCTGTTLQPTTTSPPAVDDELEVQAQYCTSPPTNQKFPVKILFLIDTSDSMIATDFFDQRGKAVGDVLNRYAGYPNVEFSVIAFDSELDPLTVDESGAPIFTNSPDIPKILSRVGGHDKLTDYQGVLGMAYTTISQDALKSSAADRSRSKYVVVFLSDGIPDPACSAETTNCSDQDPAATGTCAPGSHCKLPPNSVQDGCTETCCPDVLVCTVPKENWASAFAKPLPTSVYPALQAGGDYNQRPQILHAIDQIVQLQDFYRLGQVELDTNFLFNQATAANSGLEAEFELDEPAGRSIMTAMAEHGHGTFQEFTSASQISFANLDFTSFQEQNGLVATLVTNTNAIQTGKDQEVDTDGDGLTDAYELSIGTCTAPGGACPTPKDTDGDGYSDFVEDRNRVSGMDPLDPKKPAIVCTERVDADGDGLSSCEETFLQTDPSNPDTDEDGINDGRELFAGTNPKDAADAFGDINQDGIRNFDEVRMHLSPTAAVAQSELQYSYVSSLLPMAVDGGSGAGRCFQLDVQHIRLVTTGAGTGAQLGKNRIMIYADQAPVDSTVAYGQYSVACLDVLYIDNALKIPQSGVVQLLPTDFVNGDIFDPAVNCKDMTGGAGIPTGVSGDASALPTDAGTTVKPDIEGH